MRVNTERKSRASLSIQRAITYSFQTIDHARRLTSIGSWDGMAGEAHGYLPPFVGLPLMAGHSIRLSPVSYGVGCGDIMRVLATV